MTDLNFLSICCTGVPGNSFIWVGTGTSGKIYKSTNSGGGWFDVSTGLTVTQVKCLAAMGPYLIAGTNNGIWRRTIAQLTSVDNQNISIPTDYSLEQNYPNPFNPSTVINYQLPAAGFVTLKVYEVNQELDAGYHEINFDASKFSSGVYFYRITTTKFSAVKKLLLMK